LVDTGERRPSTRGASMIVWTGRHDAAFKRGDGNQATPSYRERTGHP
jgi:hypothetical protein